jgi:hypothetical protein
MTVSVLGTPRKPTDEDRDKLPSLQALLGEGQRYRDAVRQGNWDTSEKQYAGDHWSMQQQEDDTADRITVNMSLSTVTTIAPYVTGEPPSHIVKPVSMSASESNARLIEAWLDRLWRRRDTDFAGELKMAVEDFLVYGDGWLRVGYELVEIEVGSQDAAQAAKLTLERLSPRNVWVDPTADRARKASWVALRSYVLLPDLMDSPYLDSEGKVLRVSDFYTEEQIPTTMTREDTDIQQTSVDAENRRYVEMIEFWDLVEKVHYRYVPGMEVPLYVSEQAESPIVNVANYRIYTSPYHFGELEQVWGLQQELNYARSQLSTHRRRNVTKVLARKGVLGEDGRAALESPRMGEVVEYEGNEPIGNLLTPLSLPPLSAEAYNSAEQAVRDIYEVTGVTEYLRGSPQGEIRRTATEATILESGSNVKVRAKLDRIETAIREIGYLLVGMARQVYTETNFDELSILLGGDYADRFNRAAAAEQQDPSLLAPTDVDVPVGPDIFEGAYDIDVEKQSTELRNPQVREQRYRQLFETVMQFAPVLQQMGVQVNVRRIMELWFDAMGITDIESLFVQQGMQGLPSPEMAGTTGATPATGAPGLLQGPPTDILNNLNTGQLEPPS